MSCILQPLGVSYHFSCILKLKKESGMLIPEDGPRGTTQRILALIVVFGLLVGASFFA
jgi:hypothetical protein